jgi:hypothetical protein
MWMMRGGMAHFRRLPATLQMTPAVVADARSTATAAPFKATRHQAMVLQAAILAALRARNIGAVLGDGPRGKWRLNADSN